MASPLPPEKGEEPDTSPLLPLLFYLNKERSFGVNWQVKTY